MSADRPSTILLVDDRPENLLALEAVLEPLGHRLLRAASGQEALKRLLTDDVSVILLDVQMPGLDGFDTAQAIKEREKTRDIPIIFITAINREPHHALRGFSTGAVDYVAKPFEPSLLQAKVQVFVELHEKNELLKRQGALLAERLEERIRAEAALARQAEELGRSNLELEQFAYVASHDLREPLVVLGGFLERLVTHHGDELSDTARMLAERSLASARRMDRLITDLLRYSRVSSDRGEVGPVDLGEVLSDVCRALEASVGEAGADVRWDGLPTVEGNAILLGQLFQNLVSNALKFRGSEAPVVQVAAEVHDDEWLISVSDNGIGIDPAHAERIFTMFERLHSNDEYPGTGIGLAICRKIVERHGGRIWVDSAPGQGATFFLTLPGVA